MSDTGCPGGCAAPAEGAPAATPNPEGYDQTDQLISIDEFCRVKLRVAEVLEAAAHPNADKLVVLKLKVGTRTKQICAGIRRSYAPEQLVGKRLIIVDNLKPVKLRGVESQGMLLAASDESGVFVLSCDKPDIASGIDVK